jgi:hypothetical protein
MMVTVSASGLTSIKPHGCVPITYLFTPPSLQTVFSAWASSSTTLPSSFFWLPAPSSLPARTVPDLWITVLIPPMKDMEKLWFLDNSSGLGLINLALLGCETLKVTCDNSLKPFFRKQQDRHQSLRDAMSLPLFALSPTFTTSNCVPSPPRKHPTTQNPHHTPK